MGRDEVHQPEAEGLHARMRRDVEGAMHGGRRLDQALQGQVLRPGGIQGAGGTLHVLHPLHLGQHDVHQAMAGLAGDRGDVAFEGRMVHRMHPHRDARIGPGTQCQRDDERRMFRFAPHRRAVFAIERDVEHAGAELLRHLLLQLQALAHARLDAAVVVAHRQHAGARLGAEEDGAGVGHGK